MLEARQIVILRLGAISLLLALAAYGCGRDGHTIGVSIRGDRWGDRSNDFYPKLQDAMWRTAHGYSYRLIVQRAGRDSAKQQQQIEDFIGNGVDAIVVVPVDSQDIDPAILEANTANIPIFTVDIGNVPGEGEVAESITSDNRSGGFEAGKIICQAIPKQAEIAVLSEPGITSAQDRVEGLKDAMKTCAGVSTSPPPIDIDSQSDINAAQYATSAILDGNPKLRAIFAINDTLALGALKALSHKGLKKVKIVGYDDTPAAEQKVDSGGIFAEVAQNPDCLGTVAIQEVHSFLATGKTIPQQDGTRTIEVPVAIYKRGMSTPSPVLVATDPVQGSVTHGTCPHDDVANRHR